LEVAKLEAERLRIESEGQAKANTIISNSLTPTLIELRRIEATATFAREGTHTVVLGTEATPLITTK
jgi:hypothetical protein